MPEGQFQRDVFPSTEAEAARQRHLNSMLNRALGGLPDLAAYARVLDLGCGPGSWVFDVAQVYPLHRIVGIDSDSVAIAVAREQALSAGRDSLPLSNVSFELVDDLAQPGAAAEAFDFVRACLLSAKLARADWTNLARESLRLLRPGGLFLITDCELPVTSSFACERFSDLIAQAYHLAGKSLSGGTRSIGITAALPHLLRTTGFRQVTCRVSVLDFSTDGPEYAAMLQNMAVALRFIQPFLINWGVTTSVEIELLYQRAVMEMRAGDFNGSLLLLTVQGEKPGA